MTFRNLFSNLNWGFGFVNVAKIIVGNMCFFEVMPLAKLYSILRCKRSGSFVNYH
jgi:hypothetical protein